MRVPATGSTLISYTTLFRSGIDVRDGQVADRASGALLDATPQALAARLARAGVRTVVYADAARDGALRSEEHTSELQSRRDLVCRLLLEKKKQCWVRYSRDV